MIDPRVLEKMTKYMTSEYGNAASNEHVFGWNANEAVNIAREKISNSINFIEYGAFYNCTSLKYIFIKELIGRAI